MSLVWTKNTTPKPRWIKNKHYSSYHRPANCYELKHHLIYELMRLNKLLVEDEWTIGEGFPRVIKETTISIRIALPNRFFFLQTLRWIIVLMRLGTILNALPLRVWGLRLAAPKGPKSLRGLEGVSGSDDVSLAASLWSSKWVLLRFVNILTARSVVSAICQTTFLVATLNAAPTGPLFGCGPPSM